MHRGLVRITLDPRHALLGYHILDPRLERWRRLLEGIRREYDALKAANKTPSKGCGSLMHDAIIKVKRRVQVLRLFNKRKHPYLLPPLDDDLKYLQKLAKDQCS